MKYLRGVYISCRVVATGALNLWPFATCFYAVRYSFYVTLATKNAKLTSCTFTKSRRTDLRFFLSPCPSSRRDKNLSYVASKANLPPIKRWALASNSSCRTKHTLGSVKILAKMRERSGEGTEIAKGARGWRVVRGNRLRGRPTGIPHISRIFLRSQRVPVIPWFGGGCGAGRPTRGRVLLPP